jgi:hypothetical protein
MDFEQRLTGFVGLGHILDDFLDMGKQKNVHTVKLMQEAVKQAAISNHWFTESSIHFALSSITSLLDESALRKWLAAYSFPDTNEPLRKIGVVMAGNIPLVGFHDFLCVLISGNCFLGKLSSRDDILLKAISDLLSLTEPGFKDRINFTDALLKDYDGVIATGSNNTARHFEYYFKHCPHIIRRNRNGIAILTGMETAEEMKALSTDIFQYFGLGCRNVSKIYIPTDYQFESFYPAMENWKDILFHHHYANNYDYNRAIFLVNVVPFLDNGFLILREEKQIASPVSVVHYERYHSLNNLIQELEIHSHEIQCVVSSSGQVSSAIPFGKAQFPELHDYADGIDTMEFLLGFSN